MSSILHIHYTFVQVMNILEIEIQNNSDTILKLSNFEKHDRCTYWYIECKIFIEH